MNEEFDQVVRKILNLIQQTNPELKFRVQDVYSNGLGFTIVVIDFLTKNDLLQGKLAYQKETGNVFNYYYHGLSSMEKITIVDLLLDILNKEKSATI